MKVYISGSITNDENYKDKFEIAYNCLKSLGHDPVTPVTESIMSYEDYIIIGLNALSRCDAMYLIDGEDTSKGVLIEKMYCQVVDKPILTIESQV